MPLQFSTPTLYATHVPDYSTEVDGNGVKQRVELPGHVEFGLIVNGVKVRIAQKATAGLLADITRAKAAADEAAAAAGSLASTTDQG
jgi:hypothetical protein